MQEFIQYFPAHLLASAMDMESARVDICSKLQQRQNKIEEKKRREKTSLDKVNSDSRYLSEMPICLALMHIGRITHFGVKNGSVLAPDFFDPHQERTYYNHTYLLSADYVVCFTAGQFVDPRNERNLKKGQRIKELKRRCEMAQHPNMVFAFEPSLGVSVVHGQIALIEHVLGMRYC